MALDHPDCVLGLAVLDIVPTWEAFSRADMAFGLGYWHWFFLAQPYDLPERLIGTDPTYFFLSHPERSAVFRPRGLRGVPPMLPRPENGARHLRGLPGRRHPRLRARRGGPPRGKTDNVPDARPVGPAGQPGRVVRRRRDLAEIGRASCRERV